MKRCVELAVCRYVRVGSCSQEDVDDLDPTVMSGIGQHGVALFILHVNQEDVVVTKVLYH